MPEVETDTSPPESNFNAIPELRNIPDSAPPPYWGATVEVDPGRARGVDINALRPSTPTIGDMGLVTPEQQKKATDQAAVAAQERQNWLEDNTPLYTQRLERDRNEMLRAKSAETASAATIPKPWNADQERADRIRGPFERFGDAATVFAMIASGFSRQPMTSALNAGAAAMNAIHASDQEGYDKAYTAWKDNTELAVKRFNMEHQLFVDSQHLFDTDVTQWAAVNTANAAKFDNKKMLALLNNGMYKEAFDVMASGVKLRDTMRESLEQGQRFDADQKELRSMWGQMAKEHGPNSFQPWNEYQVRKLENLWYNQKAARTEVERTIAQAKFDYFNTNGKDMPPQEAADLEARVRGWGAGRGAGGNPYLTSQRAIESDTQAHMKDWRAEHPKATEDEKAHEAATFRNNLRRESTPPTPGQIISQQGHAAQYAEGIRTIDTVLEVLRNYKGAAGLAGKVMRLEERLANILAGMPDAERVQMMREIEFLRLQAPNLLLDRTGRPLSTEAGRINDIVAGTSAGDTGPNTIRALEALRERYERLQSGVQERIGQSPTAAPLPAKTAPTERFWEGDK